MDGKVCVVTGATNGIGKETALALARRGVTVALVARDAARGEAAREEVARAASGGPPVRFLAELASLEDVRRLAGALAGRLPRIDMLVNDGSRPERS
jgi:NAD(P)-dependent dehydrogenase (short-subunit alcohol dehydrogenase family)